MVYLLILIPLVAAFAALFWRSQAGERGILVATAIVHLLMTASLWVARPPVEPHAWLAVDTVGLIFLTITSTLFLASSLYTLGYLSAESGARHIDRQEGFLFTSEPTSVFISCLLFFLAAMTAVTLSQHYGLLWVSVEATTLASAPLIYFHRHHRSLEATWKYLLICSVGIALALLGNFLLAVSVDRPANAGTELIVGNLLSQAGRLDPLWLKGAFLFFLVGYGTKMGLAPMHTWLPDAHSEAPSNVSALLSGALLNCAFLGIFRCHQLCAAAGQGEFSSRLLVVFGLLSMGLAAVFIVRQTDFKRMLAYSSIEHMGILSIGTGLGALGAFGALLHAFNHSLTKAALFFAAGNILSAFKSKFVADVRGLRRVLPLTSLLWIAGFLAITGTPPFGTFMSEFTILNAAMAKGAYVTAGLYLVCLAVIFIGMINIFLPMSQGAAADAVHAGTRREALWRIAPPAALMVLVLALGFGVPRWMNQALNQVAEGTPATAARERLADGTARAPFVAAAASRLTGKESETAK